MPFLLLLSLLSLLCVGAGPPVVSGSQPGALRLDPRQIAALDAARRPPAVTAPALVLVDNDTGRDLLATNADQSRPNASTTKIMTALLVLERAPLDDLVVVQPSALIGGATMGLQAGEALSVEDLLWGLLLNSANDAAMALAEHLAGSEAAFVALMNQRAAELGLAHTHFANPHGLDAPGHHSSAADLVRLAQAAMAYPVFSEMVATPTHAAAGRQLWNINLLLNAYPGADGIKTGTTDQAGECLVASASRDGHRAISVVLGSQDRYADTTALLDHYHDHYEWARAPQPSGLVAWLRDDQGRPLRVDAPGALDLFLARWQWPLLRIQPVLGGIPSDLSQPVGVVRWYLGDQLLGEAEAYLRTD